MGKNENKMNAIDVLSEIFADWKLITFETKDEIDFLRRKTIMIVQKIFGNENHYLKEVEAVSFSRISTFAGISVDQEFYFQKGLKQIQTL